MHDKEPDMPAVTADTLTLPRLAEPDLTTSTDRGVTTVATAPMGFEGEGFPVHRAFADFLSHSP